MKLLLKMGDLTLLKFTEQKLLGQLLLTRIVFNPFLVGVLVLNPLNTLENLWFCGFFREVIIRALTRNELNRELERFK